MKGRSQQNGSGKLILHFYFWLCCGQMELLKVALILVSQESQAIMFVNLRILLPRSCFMWMPVIINSVLL